MVFFQSAHEPLSSDENLEIADTSFEHTAVLWRINPILRYVAYGKTLRGAPLSRPDIVIGGEHLLLKPHSRRYPDVPWIYFPNSLTVADEIIHYHLERSLRAATLILYKHLQTWALTHAACTVRFTKLGCNALRIAYPRHTHRPLIVNPVGIDTPAQVERTPRGTQLRLLIVGSLTPRKGIDLALQALGPLVSFNWHLDIVGAGGELENLKNLARALGIAARVSFIGQVPDPEPWYRRSDLLLFPSRSESLGLVVLEAMSRGTPCLAFRSDDVTFRNVNEELITHDYDGLLASSVEEFRDQLRSLLSHPDTLVQLGNAARTTVLRRFSWQQHLKHYEHIFEEISAGHAPYS